MENIVEKNTIKFEVLALIGLFIPTTFLSQYEGEGIWWNLSFDNYFILMFYYNRVFLIIMILLIMLVIITQILRIKKSAISILSHEKIWALTLAPLAWFVISSVAELITYSMRVSDDNRLLPCIMFFVEIIVLAVPVVRHKAWMEISKSNTEDADAISRVVFVGTIIVAIIIFLVFGISSCSLGGGSSYYLDYNNNGQMDDGEHVYDEYDDGSGGFDYDGDGWNEYNYDTD